VRTRIFLQEKLADRGLLLAVQEGTKMFIRGDLCSHFSVLGLLKDQGKLAAGEWAGIFKAQKQGNL
jgi:hypothetical protein